MPVKLTYESAKPASALWPHLSLSLDGVQIERPNLLFAKVDDELEARCRHRALKAVGRARGFGQTRLPS